MLEYHSTNRQMHEIPDDSLSQNIFSPGLCLKRIPPRRWTTEEEKRNLQLLFRFLDLQPKLKY